MTNYREIVEKSTDLINDTLQLNDAHFWQSSFEKLNNRLKTDALFYELLVVGKQHQCHLQYHFLTLEKYQIWHSHNTTEGGQVVLYLARHHVAMHSLIMLADVK